MESCHGICAGMVIGSLAVLMSVAVADEYPDVRTVKQDLEVPRVQPGPPRSGTRVLYSGRGGKASSEQPQATLMLPENWTDREKWAVFVELPGNGGYRDPRGDECTDRWVLRPSPARDIARKWLERQREQHATPR